MRGNSGTQRKALGYFAQDLDARENIVALLSALGIKGDPERFFDRSFFGPSVGYAVDILSLAQASIHVSSAMLPLNLTLGSFWPGLPAIVTKDILAWEKICWT
jgi:hypothetical protein